MEPQSLSSLPEEIFSSTRFWQLLGLEPEPEANLGKTLGIWQRSGIDFFVLVNLNPATMCVAAAHSIYMPSGNWCDSSDDYLSLLHANEGEVFYVSPRNRMGSQQYLARRAFLRSYHFCVEETFKDKLRRLLRRFNEQSLDEIVKSTVRKGMRATKVFLSHNYEFLVERKTKQMINLRPVACLRVAYVVENKYKGSSGE